MTNGDASPSWKTIFKSYSWSVVFLLVLLALVIICKLTIGEYPFDVSEALLFCYTNYGALINETSGVMLLIVFAWLPVLIAGKLLKRQGKKLAGPLLPKESKRVRLFFATLIAACFLINALPTYTCHNAMCDYVPLVASFPGLVVGIPLAQGIDFVTSNIGGLFGLIDWRPLVILPNGILVWLLVFYFLTPRLELPRLLRRRWLVVGGAIAVLLILLVIGAVYLERQFFRLTDEKLRELVSQYAPASPPGEDFEFQIGDVIIQRPHGEAQDMIAKLSGTNLAHTDTYCGNGDLINANGEDLIGTGGINIDKLDWKPRYSRGSLPTSVVMRHPDPAVGEQLCRQLREVEARPDTTFGLDLLGKRHSYNCSNFVLYHLDPEVKNFNLVTPDLVFVYMLEHDWQLLNWSN